MVSTKTASVRPTNIRDVVVLNSLSPNEPPKTDATVNLVTPVKKGVPATDSMKAAANIESVLKDPPSPVQDDDVSFVGTNLPVGKLLSRTDFRKEETIDALFDAILDEEVYVPESVREEKGKINTMRWKCVASILKNKLRSKCSDRACQINANKNIVAVREYLKAEEKGEELPPQLKAHKKIVQVIEQIDLQKKAAAARKEVRVANEAKKERLSLLGDAQRKKSATKMVNGELQFVSPPVVLGKDGVMKDETGDGATDLQEVGVGGGNNKRRRETLFDMLMEQTQLRLKIQRTLLNGPQAKYIDHLDQRILTLENKIDHYFDKESNDRNEWKRLESEQKQPKK